MHSIKLRFEIAEAGTSESILADFVTLLPSWVDASQGTNWDAVMSNTVHDENHVELSKESRAGMRLHLQESTVLDMPKVSVDKKEEEINKEE